MAPYKHQVRSPFWLRVLSCTPFEADSTSASTTETDLGISDRHLMLARWDKGTTLQKLAVSFSSRYSSHCLQSCAGCCAVFSSHVVFKMADSNNTALTKWTGGFFIDGHAVKMHVFALSHTHTHGHTRKRYFVFRWLRAHFVYLPLQIETSWWNRNFILPLLIKHLVSWTFILFSLSELNE